MNTNSTIKTGIAGLGRSGWGIHGSTLLNLPEEFQIVSVFDGDRTRQKEVAQTVNCDAPDSLEDMLANPGIELVVVATPNALHTRHALLALRNQKHVVVEKPVALSCVEMDELIAMSREQGRRALPFQQRRYEPQFRKVAGIIQSGLLGRIIEIRICWHGFKRRWDWQTLKEFSGGSLNNNGPHMLDHALALLPEGVEPEVFCDLQRGISLGDAEDHVKIILKSRDAPTIDMELSDVIAFPQNRWLVSGTNGGLTSTESGLHWKWVDWTKMPAREVERTPPPNRDYNNETLTWNEERWETPASFDAPRAFYNDVYRTLRHNEPPVITLESVRRCVSVMEQCQRLNPSPM